MVLDTPRLRIGADPKNDIILKDRWIDDFHAEIITEEDEIYVLDLDSASGTVVNDECIDEKHKLEPQDIIKLGNSTIKVMDIDPDEFARMELDAQAPAEPEIEIGSPTKENTKWYIEGQSKDFQKMKFFITSTQTVGRDESNDIVIKSDGVSRKHAQLYIKGGKLMVEDLASINGTFVNGVETRESELNEGDKVGFDLVRFMVGKSKADPDLTVIRIPATDLDISDDKVESTAGETVVHDIEDLSVPEDIVASVGGPKDNFPDFKDIDEEEIDFDSTSVKRSTHYPMFGWLLALLSLIIAGFIVNSAFSPGLIDTTTLNPLIEKIKGLELWESRSKGEPGGNLARQGGDSLQRLDSKLMWEQSMTHSASNPATPALADINGDGSLDVIIASATGMALAFNGQDGKQLFKVDNSAPVFAAPATADLDGDGSEDIIIADNSGGVTALDGKGKTLWKAGSGLQLGSVINMPTIRDITGDNIPDIIVPTIKKGLVALDGSNGAKLWDTAHLDTGALVAVPLLADLNRDGPPEFITVSSSGKVAAVTGRRDKPALLWSANIPPVQYSSPAYGKAGKKGLVVFATKESGLIALSSMDGKVVWKYDVKSEFFSSPVIADMDGDNVSEIAIVSTKGDIHILDLASGEEDWRAPLGAKVKASLALVDFDNNGVLNIIALDQEGAISVVDVAGRQVVLNIPVEGANSFVASPTVGDINGDGTVDIATASQNGKISVYSFNRKTEPNAAIWPAFLGGVNR